MLQDKLSENGLDMHRSTIEHLLILLYDQRTGERCKKKLGCDGQHPQWCQGMFIHTDAIQTHGFTVAPFPPFPMYSNSCLRPYGDKSVAKLSRRSRVTVATCLRNTLSTAKNKGRRDRLCFREALFLAIEPSSAKGSRCGKAARTRCLEWSESQRGGSSESGTCGAL